MKTTQLIGVHVVWGLVFQKGKPGLVGFGEGSRVSTSLTASCWKLQVLWVSLESSWWLLLLSAAIRILGCLVASVCCWRSLCPGQMNLNFYELLVFGVLFSTCVCPCFSLLGWSTRASILLQFAASEMLKRRCLIGILVFHSSWLTLQLLKASSLC